MGRPVPVSRIQVPSLPFPMRLQGSCVSLSGVLAISIRREADVSTGGHRNAVALAMLKRYGYFSGAVRDESNRSARCVFDHAHRHCFNNIAKLRVAERSTAEQRMGGGESDGVGWRELRRLRDDCSDRNGTRDCCRRKLRFGIRYSAWGIWRRGRSPIYKKWPASLRIPAIFFD